MRALSYTLKTGNLPSARLGYGLKPFSGCEVDYFDQDYYVGKNRCRREKRRGMHYTCLTTRAIWLETAQSMCTDSSIMAFERLAARRCWLSLVWSDNGTNFRGASVELREALRLMNRERQRALKGRSCLKSMDTYNLKVIL